MHLGTLCLITGIIGVIAGLLDISGRPDRHRSLLHHLPLPTHNPEKNRTMPPDHHDRGASVRALANHNRGRCSGKRWATMAALDFLIWESLGVEDVLNEAIERVDHLRTR